MGKDAKSLDKMTKEGHGVAGFMTDFSSSFLVVLRIFNADVQNG